VFIIHNKQTFDKYNARKYSLKNYLNPPAVLVAGGFLQFSTARFNTLCNCRTRSAQKDSTKNCSDCTNNDRHPGSYSARSKCSQSSFHCKNALLESRTLRFQAFFRSCISPPFHSNSILSLTMHTLLLFLSAR